MRYYFIINPKAGKGSHAETLEKKIRGACDARSVDYEIYFTTAVGDATRFVREKCSEVGALPAKFFACGGDGTLGEVVNGALGVRDASIGLIPMGTGNDFVRNFESDKPFFDINAQLDGTDVLIDVIKCNELYAINMINIGFDCEVVKKKESIQKRGFFPSKLAYVLGLVYTLVKKPGVCAKLSFDGEEGAENKYLLTTFANGAFCGGGFKSNPQAHLNDGKIDALLVNNISRTKFVSLVGSYKSGTHLTPKNEKILSAHKCASIDIRFSGTQSISVDGELFDFESISISSVPNALGFSIPKGIDLSGYEPLLELESATV